MSVVTLDDLDGNLVAALFAINQAPDGIETKTHFQKAMYMVLKALGVDPRSSAGYVPHKYGPYSRTVDGWRDALLDMGAIEKNANEKVTIAPRAKDEVDKITLNDDFLELQVRYIVEFITSLDYDELLLWMYSYDIRKNEGMLVNSEIYEGVFENRVDTALNMVRGDKVTIAKGAELADMDVADFRKLL